LSSRDSYVDEAFIKRLRHVLKGFKGLSDKHQHALAWYILEENSPDRRHNLFKGCATFHHKELERDFGRGVFERINNQLGVFAVTDNWYFMKDGKPLNQTSTKGYRLKPKVAGMRDRYLERYLKPKPSEPLTDLVTVEGTRNPKLTRKRNLPTKSISANDKRGNTRKVWRRANPPGRIEVDVDMLRRLHADLSRKEKSKGLSSDMFAQAEGEDIPYLKDSIEKLLAMAHTKAAGYGYIWHHYTESQAGRLYADGLSLQTVPRLIRQAALHGCYDNDFENCHYAIFAQLADAYGYDCQSIKHYMAHKNQVREGIATRVGITIDQAKDCLLATMYGAKKAKPIQYPNKRDQREKCAIPQKIGDKAEVLYRDKEYAGLADDIQKGRKIIIDGWPIQRNSLINDVGKGISKYETLREKLAHIIQGIEAKALRAAHDLHEDDLVLLLHDGFITNNPIDTSALRTLVFDRTDYDLHMTTERIQIPPDLGIRK